MIIRLHNSHLITPQSRTAEVCHLRYKKTCQDKQFLRLKVLNYVQLSHRQIKVFYQPKS